ncbi:hypothetical protein H4219_005190, partial [Mycoemilia scoparia]
KANELKEELSSEKKDPKNAKKIAAMKKVVANMTMGSDMSSLYQEVLACMRIPNLEIKKMVYLYLINYSRSKPDIAKLAIPYLDDDANDGNPLVRAMAIRTMSYMHVDQVLESLVVPLRHALRDKDPYVRKTAAMAVLKLCLLDRSLVEEENFLDMLKGLLADPNPSVVANSVAALVEISERSPNIKLKLNMKIANKLISALNECNEWGQVYILESLLFVIPQEESDAEIIIERIISRLQHNNSSVVLTAVKVVVYMMNYISNIEQLKTICKKMSPPLVTLLNSGPEVQYVTLRNIQLILQRWPTVLESQLRDFFCKYNDSIYVKLAKLEIIFRLTNESNARIVLSELSEYASEVDVDFARKAVRSIGRIAIKINSVADQCIKTLLGLIDTKINYVLQEGIVVIKDILRKYPNRYESIIGTLCENLDSLDEPEARAAMIWFIGQYADRIDSPEEVLNTFLDRFMDEPTEVQLALLTATMKLFITRPIAGQDLVPKVLKWATEDVDNPDLRDRGFIYWRLLSTDPEAAKAIVLSEKPQISTETENMDPYLLEELLLHVSTLSAVYQKPPAMFINGAKRRALPQSSALYRLKVEAEAFSEAPAEQETKKEKRQIGDLGEFDDSPLSLPVFGSRSDRQNMQNLNPYIDSIDPAALRFSSGGGDHADGSVGKIGSARETVGSGGIMRSSSNTTDIYDMASRNSANNNSAYFRDLLDLGASDINKISTDFEGGGLGTSSATAQAFSSAFGPLGSSTTATTSPPTPLGNAFTNSFTPHETSFRSDAYATPIISPTSTSGLQTPTTASRAKTSDDMPSSSSVVQISNSMQSMSFSDTTNFGSHTLYVPAKKVLLDSQQASGLEIVGTFARRNGQMQMELTLINRGSVPVNGFAIQFNSNYFGIVPAAPLSLPVAQLYPNSSAETAIPLVAGGPTQAMSPVNNLQIAVNSSLGIFYFQTQYSFHILFTEEGKLEQNTFLKLWREIPTISKQISANQHLYFAGTEDIRNKLNMNNVFTVAQRQINNSINFYTCAKIVSGMVFLSEIKFDSSFREVTITTKSMNPELIDVFQDALLDILTASTTY